MAYITNIVTRHPEFSFSQQDAEEAISRWLVDVPALAQKSTQIVRRSGIKTRYAPLPVQELIQPRSLVERNQLYHIYATELAIQTAQEALEVSSLLPRDIDIIIFTSCTGYSLPGIECAVCNALSLPENILRLPFAQFGCSGGVRGLSVAHDILKAYPEKIALVLSVEFPTLTFCSEDRSPRNLVSAALFGDGAGCAVVKGDRCPAAGIQISSPRSLLIPNSESIMGFELTDLGFQIVLDKQIPALMASYVREALWSFIAEQELSLDFAAIHPGGNAILEALEQQCELPSHLLQPARNILSNHGNMSGTTVLFILQELLQTDLRGTGLTLAVGPGFSLDMLKLAAV